MRPPDVRTTAVVMLALGIGATTAIFSVINGVLLNPLPYPQSDALVRIVHNIGGVDQPYFHDALYVTYADNTLAFQDLGAWVPGGTATITGNGEPEEVPALIANRGVLTTLGVQPEIGRWFSTADDTPGAPHTVILGHGYWQRRFGGDRRVLERTLIIDARPHQVIGVMPARFRFEGDQDVILPLQIDRGRLNPEFRLLAVARLKPGVTLAQSNTDAARVLQIWFENFKVNPAVRPRWAAAHRSLKQDVVGDVGTSLWILMATTAIVLFMACVNVANLLLVRGAARQREFAIRLTLGARWTRIARQLLVESLTLALLGGALGVALAYAGLRVLFAIGPSNLPRLNEISLDPTALGFTLTISLLSGLLFGLIPIVKYARPFDATRSRPYLANAIGSGRSVSMSPETQRTQQALVAMQVALALVLLVSAGLMIRSFQSLRRLDPGFTDAQRLQTFTISIPTATVPDPIRVTRMQRDILDRISSIPGVAATAFTTRVPMASDRASAALAVEGRADDGRTPANRQVKIISPGMFQTMGTPLVAGRDFTWTDLEDRRDVTIISENLARELWGSAAAALGKRLREYYAPKQPWREIVGVVADVYDDGADQEAPATIYWPAQAHERLLSMSSGYQSRRVSVVVRSDRAGTQSLLNQLRDAVWTINPSLPLSHVRTVGDVYGQSLARTSFTLVMLASAGGMAMLLGVSGLYGVVAYAVSQRRREIGIRLALGAQAHEIRRLFLRRGLVVVSVGVAIGLAVAAGFTRLMESLLFGVSPLDPVTFIAMPAVLAFAAVLASYLPASGATTVDPVETLRAE